MLNETIRRTADGIYLGQVIRIRTEAGFTHPAKVVYVHHSGKWVMLEISLSNGNRYHECFQTFELIDRGIISMRTAL